MKISFTNLRYIFILSFLVLLTATATHSSVKSIPNSYKQETSDGKCVFVMLALTKKADGSPLNTDKDEKSLKIEAQYSSSGLYLISDSSKPLWTVDWYSYQTFLSADGKHLVRIGRDRLESSNEAISFYETNTQIKTYKISDIVDFAPLLPSPFLLDWESEMFINVEENTLTVKTLTFDTLVFDLKTGKEIKSIRPIRSLILGIFGLSLAITFLYLKNKKIKVKKFLYIFN